MAFYVLQYEDPIRNVGILKSFMCYFSSYSVCYSEMYSLSKSSYAFQIRRYPFHVAFLSMFQFGPLPPLHNPNQAYLYLFELQSLLLSFEIVYSSLSFMTLKV